MQYFLLLLVLFGWTFGAVYVGEQRQIARAAEIQAVIEREAGDKAVNEYKKLQIREEDLNDSPPDNCKLSPPLIRTMLGLCKRQKCA